MRQVPAKIEQSPLHIAAQLRQLADETERIEAATRGGWVDDLGEVLTSAEAAEAAGVSAETVRRWCVESPRKIGRLFAGVWLISRTRLLLLIEERYGRPAMLAARTRAEKMLECRSLPQRSTQTSVAATG